MLRSITKYVFLFTLSFIFSLGLVLGFGVGEKFSIHILQLVGLLISLLLFRKIFKLTISSKSLLLAFLIFFILSETLLLIFSPLHTFLPEKTLLSLRLLKNIDYYPECDTANKVYIAKEFMKYDVNLSKIKIYYSREKAIPRFFKKLPSNIKATTFGNNIYIYGTDQCITTPTLVHELTHVWQHQNKLGVGINWAAYWLNYFITFLTDFKSLYDYGGIDGLAHAREQGKKFRDFGMEQQASITANYFVLVTSTKPLNPIEKSDTINLYNYFLDGEFNFVKQSSNI